MSISFSALESIVPEEDVAGSWAHSALVWPECTRPGRMLSLE
jgi:hypothetical protein